MLIFGQCRCGNLSFTLDWPSELTAIPARACTCSFCRTHRGVWTAAPGAKLQLRIAHPERLERHRFATGSAEFLLCRQCKEVPAVTSEIDGRLYAVVNSHALRAVDPARFDHRIVDFSGESLAERLARRQSHWIPEVFIASAAD